VPLAPRLNEPRFSFVLKGAFAMFGRSGYSFASPANVGDIERRLRSLEQQLERVGGRGAATAGRRANDVKETIVSVLTSITDQFMRNANDMGAGTTKFSSEAVKLGNDTLRRLSKQVERRPLLTLALAIGVGAIVGLVSHRR
jgi:ElaB/YqjD/DUF883 family membrane-anchored ribosome-binding protein